MATHPRWIGAGLGALVGIVLVVAGVILGNLLYDRAGLSMNLVSFAGVGIILAIVALPTGAVLALGALLGRRRMIGTGALFALAISVATDLIVTAISFAGQSGPTRQPTETQATGTPFTPIEYVIFLLPLLLSVGIAAAVAWVALLRALAKGPRQSILAFVDVTALLALTILVESLLLPQY